MQAFAAPPLPPIVRGLFLWQKFAPRASSAVPRAVGRMLPPSDIFVRTQHGAFLKVDYNNLDFYASVFNQKGFWDDTMTIAPQILRPNDVFYDIGANAGIVAFDAAAKVSKDLRIICVEPQPNFKAPALASAKINGLSNFVWLECLLGDEDGEATLHLTSHAIHASMVPREAKSLPLKREIWRLDTLVDQHRIPPPDVIKIDVEGFELSVFAGGAETLRKSQPCILFEADENLNRFNKTVADVFAALSALAPYEFHFIAEGGAMSPAKPPYPIGNFLAITPSQKHRLEGIEARFVRAKAL